MSEAKKRFSKEEELANAISHGVGLFLAIVASTLLIAVAIMNKNAWQILSTSIFGFTLITLYFSSTMNHSLLQGKAKDFFHNFDQIAIYLLIAGTYTPIALSIIRTQGGWLMFGLEWGFAISGLIVKSIFQNKFEKGVNIYIIISYVIMGWLLLFFLKPVFSSLSSMSIILIFAGGVAYTLGILFFKLEKMKYSHLIWHLFVMAGSICHWTAIFIAILNH
jgi:hemolysin III